MTTKTQTKLNPVASAINAAILSDTAGGTLHSFVKSVMPKTSAKGKDRKDFTLLARERIGARLAKHMASDACTDTETLWIKGAVTFKDTGAVLNTRYAKGTKVSGQNLSEKVISLYATIGNVAKEYGLTGASGGSSAYRNKASETVASGLKGIIDEVLSDTTVKEANQFDKLWLKRVLLEQIGKELAETEPTQ